MIDLLIVITIVYLAFASYRRQRFLEDEIRSLRTGLAGLDRGDYGGVLFRLERLERKVETAL